MDNSLTFSSAAVNLLAQFEGFRPAPYLDSVGVPTIGYGTTFYEDGTKVTMNDDHIDQIRAKSILLNYLNVRILPDFHQHITVDLTQNQVDALCCLVYNIGDSGFDHSHVLSDINSHITGGTLQAHWLSWSHAGGVINPGLLKRRQKEYNYFTTGTI